MLAYVPDGGDAMPGRPGIPPTAYHAETLARIEDPRERAEFWR